MSDRLEMELDLDNDLPADGPDAPVGEWDDDLMDAFPDDDPAAHDAVPASGQNPGPATRAAGDPPPKPAAPVKGGPGRQKAGRAGVGTAVFFCVLVLLAGLTLGAGVLTATGGAPEAMLDFSGFSDPLAIGDLQAHPVNAFWLAAGVTLLAGLLVAVGIQRRLRAMQEIILEQHTLLDAVGALDPDVPESWRHEALLNDPDLSTVTGNLLGHYHLQQAKLTRYVGLEGELHRLEKAIAEDSQVDLQGNWESPAAGSLADQALRLLAARDEAARNISQQQETVAEQGPDLMVGLRDARHWQGTAVDQLQHQGAALERLSRHLGKLAGSLPDSEDGPRRHERLVQALAAVRDGLASLPARGVGREGGDQGSLSLVIERASRLAFQIAMEVARLGAKGERLLPLTQDLEELTTELRAMMDPAAADAGAEDPRERVLEMIRGRLGELDPQALQTLAPADLPRSLSELAPLATETAAELAKLARNFSQQTSRLQQVSHLASELTGLPIEDGGGPETAGGGMMVDRFDPFASGSQPESGLVADPFASSGGSIFDGPGDGASDFAHTALPGEAESLFTAAKPEPGALDLDLDVEPTLPSEEEMVYDLAEFDAIPLPPDPGDGPSAAPVHELCEFDAVRIA